MQTETWTTVDQYFAGTLVSEDAALISAQSDAANAGLPSISVSPPQGKLLHLLALIQQATRILEVGTLAGYSTIWLARALGQGGRLVTIEFDPRHAAVARSNIERAGLLDNVDLRVGDANDILPQLYAEKTGPFDLTFIDADKVSTPAYFEWSLKLARPGSIIIVDNVVRNGKVIDAATEDPGIRGIRRFNEMVAANPKVSATAIQTVGVKGYDGFALVRVNT